MHSSCDYNNYELNPCKSKLVLLLQLNRADPSYRDRYNLAKQEYEALLKQGRSLCIGVQLKNSDNKTRCMWTICNHILGKDSAPTVMDLEGDMVKLALQYNEFLTSTVSKATVTFAGAQSSLSIKENDQSLYLNCISQEKLCELAND
ncbi:hypothetical protein QE152_g10494 [Popillia japonica]|uniref:Uncharacterized protein n=1 Tax=Popillia japonica TaxID=7064 RepID=A0AAW1LUX7_POPJA